ncbi:hypothetical protein FQR65_LT04434 [Abscondita terminalis]|nr:hypothetical protein FQR65_LT04434 [Abscondita terminalis]
MLEVPKGDKKKKFFTTKSLFKGPTDVDEVSLQLQEYIKNNLAASQLEKSEVSYTSFQLNSIVTHRNSIISGNNIDLNLNLSDVALNTQSNFKDEQVQNTLEGDVVLLDDTNDCSLDSTSNALSDLDRPMIEHTSKILLSHQISLSDTKQSDSGTENLDINIINISTLRKNKSIANNCSQNVPSGEFNSITNPKVNQFHNSSVKNNSDENLTTDVAPREIKITTINRSQNVPLGKFKSILRKSNVDEQPHGSSIEENPHVILSKSKSVSFKINPKPDEQFHGSSDKENSNKILTNEATLRRSKRIASNHYQTVPLGEVNPNIINLKHGKQLHHSSDKENSDVILTEMTQRKSTRITTNHFRCFSNDADAQQLHRSNVENNSDKIMTKNSNEKVSVLKMNGSSTQNLDCIRTRENGRLRSVKKPEKY